MSWVASHFPVLFILVIHCVGVQAVPDDFGNRTSGKANGSLADDNMMRELFETQMNDLRSQLKTLTNEMWKLRNETSAQFMTTMRSDLESSQEWAKNRIDTLQARVDEESYKCSFHAIYNATDRVTKGRVLVFRNIMSNVGGGYNHTTGFFTAPRDGTYGFGLTVTLSHPDATKLIQINVKLETRGTNMGSVVSGSTGIGLDQSSSFKVIDLKRGQVVKPIVVYAHLADSDSLHTSPKTSSFSGFLL